MIRTRYLDLDCIALQNASIELFVTESVGPRIIRLNLHGEANILAELPHVQFDYPGIDEKFIAYGGHRFWHAPQMPVRTHIPDNRPVAVATIPNGVAVTQDTETRTGIRKTLHIILPDDSPTVIVDHILTNEGVWPITTAPWGITELREGGVAICPQTDQFDDPDGVLPNRTIALWPFTSIRSPHIDWGDRFIFVHATMQEAMLKFGFPNPVGWLAYHVDDTLFVKHAAFDRNAAYFDRGSSSQIYCMPEFIELETVGPRTVVQPGESVSHRETWTLYPNIEFTPDEAAAVALAQKLNL
jgi:hypothetical protein